MIVTMTGINSRLNSYVQFGFDASLRVDITGVADQMSAAIARTTQGDMTEGKT